MALPIPRLPRSLAVAALALHAGASGSRAAPDAAALGKPIYDKLCGACHQIGPGAANGTGPQLNGVLGMPAADKAGYEYSTALKHSAIVWSDDAFLGFIADPATTVPGTRMTGPKVDQESERRAILAYVKKFAADASQAR